VSLGVLLVLPAVLTLLVREAAQARRAGAPDPPQRNPPQRNPPQRNPLQRNPPAAPPSG